MSYNPYISGMQSEQAALQQRIQQLEQMRQQQIYPQYGQVQQTPVATQNVNWIPVTGVEGAKNQIVQPGETLWMMDNNAPYFYVKSVDNFGSPSFKACRFEEVPVDMLVSTHDIPKVQTQDYVTREEFNALLTRLGELPEKGVEE